MKKTTNEPVSVPAGTQITPKLLVSRQRNNGFEKVSRIFAFLMITVFPLFIMNITNKLNDEGKFILYSVGNFWYYNITQVKITSFRVITLTYIIVCVLLLCTFLWNKKAAKSRLLDNSFKLTLPQKLMIAYLIWVIFTAFFAKDYEFNVLWLGFRAEHASVGIRTEGIYHALLYGFIFVLLSYFGEYTENYMRGMGVMAGIFGFVCVLQSFGVNLLYPEETNYWGSQFLGTVGNIDCIGGICAMVIPALFCGYVLIEDKWRYACLPGLVLMTYTMLFCDVDSGKMGLIAAFLVTMPFLLENRKRIIDTLQCGAVFSATAAVCYMLNVTYGGKINFNFGKKVLLFLAVAVLAAAGSYVLSRKKEPLKFSPAKMRRTVAIVIAGIVLAALLFLFIFDIGDRGVLHDMHDVLHGNLTDNAGSNHGYTWKVCFKLMFGSFKNAIVGTGPGTFYYEYWPHIRNNTAFDLAHNEFLQIGVHSGIIGLALYIAFVASVAVRAVKAAPRCPMVIILASAFAGYLAHSFFSFSIAIVTPIFWVLTGLLDKCIRQMPPENKEDAE
ncbi:MAG: O-antigen ligase family protein [Clostridiales bacterium]|nr:O-antigen ligase family protein [Clostridiales bacterium]